MKKYLNKLNYILGSFILGAIILLYAVISGVHSVCIGFLVIFFHVVVPFVILLKTAFSDCNENDGNIDSDISSDLKD